MDTREDIFDALGFHYGSVEQPAAPAPMSREVVVDRVQSRFAEMVYNTVYSEDIGFSAAEAEQLLGGVTVGGHTLEQEQQLLNEARAWHHLISLVSSGEFRLNEKVYCELHRLLARDPGLTWGVFENPEVPVGRTYRRTPRRYIVDERFEPGMRALEQIDEPRERAAAAFLFVSLNTFLVNFNGRVARLLMQGILMQHGFVPIMFAPRQQVEFDIEMMRFYDSLDATHVMQFLLSPPRSASPTPPKKRWRRQGRSD